MKTFKLFAGAFLFGVFIGLIPLNTASASDRRVCTLSGLDAGTSGAQATSANASCVWPTGAVVMFQCQASGGATSDASVYYSGTGTAATIADERITFPGDPYPVMLRGSENAISVKSAGTLVDCTFFATGLSSP